MNEVHSDLKTRTKQFALRVIRLYSALPKTTEAQLVFQTYSGYVASQFKKMQADSLVAELKATAEKSSLPEAPSGKAALNDLLVRLRLAEAQQ